MSPDRAGFASVVLPLLPAKPPEDLKPDDVARLTCETLSALLRDSIGEQQAVLVLEDVHWMDTGSWMLTAQVAQDIPRLLPDPPGQARPRRGLAGNGKAGADRH